MRAASRAAGAALGGLWGDAAAAGPEPQRARGPVPVHRRPRRPRGPHHRIQPPSFKPPYRLSPYLHTILRPLLPYRSTPITTPPLPNQPLAHPAALNRAAAGNAVHSAAPFEQRADSWARHAPRPPQELLLGGHFWGPGGLPEELGELVRLARLDLGGLPLLHDWLRDPAARRRHALAPVRDSSRVSLSAPPPPPPPPPRLCRRRVSLRPPHHHPHRHRLQCRAFAVAEPRSALGFPPPRPADPRCIHRRRRDSARDPARRAPPAAARRRSSSPTWPTTPSSPPCSARSRPPPPQ